MLTDLADEAPTPASLLDLVARQRAVADDAERQILVAAVAWAHAHPVLEPNDESWQVAPSPGFSLCELDQAALEAVDEEGCAWFSIPPVAWHAPAAFAAANHQSEVAGKALMRDALVLRHRMPRTWARLLAGDVPAWRARVIAKATLGRPGDVVADLDVQIAPIAATVGPITLDRLLDESYQRLHAEERELESLEALDNCHVTLHQESINHTGIADLTIRGDWKDLHDFDGAVAEVAQALHARGCDAPLDVRRSMAVGVLADPAQALALLTDTPAPTPRKATVLYLHLSADAVAGHDTVGRNETTGRPELEQLIRAWCGRVDSHVTVKPVIDLADHHHVAAYEIPDRLREQSTLLHGTCVHPWCTRPARGCDVDHITPFGSEGPTCSCNVAPLCRHHHLLKTHTPWTYKRIDACTFVWSDPYGRRYVKQRGRTTVVDETSSAELRTA